MSGCMYDRSILKAPIEDSWTIHRHGQLSNMQFYCRTSKGNFTQSEMEASEPSTVSEPPELDDSWWEWRVLPILSRLWNNLCSKIKCKLFRWSPWTNLWTKLVRPIRWLTKTARTYMFYTKPFSFFFCHSMTTFRFSRYCHQMITHIFWISPIFK